MFPCFGKKPFFIILTPTTEINIKQGNYREPMSLINHFTIEPQMESQQMDLTVTPLNRCEKKDEALAINT